MERNETQSISVCSGNASKTMKERCIPESHAKDDQADGRIFPGYQREGAGKETSNKGFPEEMFWKSQEGNEPLMITKEYIG